MTFEHHSIADRSELVYQYSAQLYRLAFLVSGNPRNATKLIEHVYAAPTQAEPTTEATLIQRLLPRQRFAPRAWQVRADRVAADRAALDQRRADALLALLGRRTPTERLIIGLHYLRGFGAQEIAALLGANTPNLIAVLSQLRCAVAVALGYAPAAADAATLALLDQWLDGALDDDAMIAVRQRIFEDATVRELRDALIAVRELLPRAIPALFAVPAGLTERLLARAEQPTAARRSAMTGVRLALVGAVLVIVAAIIFGPGLLRQSTATSSVSLTPIEIVDAAMHRFDRAALQTGVLHERYRIEHDGNSQIVERWYDYASPHRVAFTLRRANDNGVPQVAISSDGSSVIQYRYAPGTQTNPKSLDVRVTPDEAQTALPMLRNFSSTRLFFNERDATDVAPMYLAQARANNLRSLGQTTLLGRSAFLLAYDQPAAANATQANAQGERVLLTVDAQTYALLDVAIIPQGAAESTAQHPLRADTFEILQTASAALFTLPSDAQTVTRTGLTSVYLPTLFEGRVLTLADAARQTTEALLVPQQLPDDRMRGFALNGRGRNGVVLMYEGEFQSTLLLPQGQWRAQSTTLGDERSAGAFRYRLVRGIGDPQFVLSAQVYRPEAPDQQLLAVLLDLDATDAEREERLARVIASLTPVTSQNILSLQERFYPPVTAGG